MDRQAWTGQQPIQQPSSTMSGSTPNLRNDDANISTVLRELAFPQDRSSCTAQEMFVGRICFNLLESPLAEKQVLLTCSETDRNMDVASFALSTFTAPGELADLSMSHFRRRLRSMLETLQHMPGVQHVTPELSEDGAIALCDQALETLSPVADRSTYIFLCVFGNVPELWRLLALAKASGGPDRKGKGRARDTHSLAAPVPTIYQPRPTDGTSQLLPALSLDQGGPSTPPEGWQQSAFSRRQPESPAVDEEPVQGTSGATSQPSPPLPPFDLSKLSNELHSVEREFHLPESENDLGQATAALQRHLRAGSSTNLVTSLLDDHASTELPDHPPLEYTHFRTARGVWIHDTARRLSEWHWWMLDLKDTCDVLGLTVPPDFQHELARVVRVEKFLTLLALRTTGQLQDD